MRVADRPSTRERPTLLLALAAGALALRLASGSYDILFPQRVNDLIHWVPASAVSAGTERATLYDFSAGWCDACRKMQREVFADSSAASFINEKFVAVRVDDDDPTAEARALRERYHVHSLPTLIVETGAKPESRIEGYRNKRETLAALEKALLSKPQP